LAPGARFDQAQKRKAARAAQVVVKNGSYSYHALAWQSSTERLASGVCNSHVDDIQYPPLHMHVLDRRDYEAGADKAAHQVGAETMGCHNRVSAAVSSGLGKQSEGAEFVAGHSNNR
jgi:hypothetical protein